jgi:hypothetical protein
MSEDASGQAPTGEAKGQDTRGHTLEELEALSTHELHDRAWRRAEKHMDISFFWSLIEDVPAAEALAGKMGEADFDIRSARGQLKDALRSGDGALGEALRPVFIDYLHKHPDA